jgi:ubiquinone/menaquinone biosynthesis C-methylase UbiE
MMTDNKQLGRQDWVKESRFGDWFTTTDTWINRVLKIALDDLESLMTSKLDRYPTILDIGFGHGHSLLMLDRRFHPDKLIGLDISPEASELAADKIVACTSEVQIIVNNAAAIELPDNSVDMVLCHQTLHHIADQVRAVREFYRVLKPGGVLLMAESCRKFIHSWPVRIFFRHPADVQKTDIEYLQLLEDSGFVVRPDNVSKPYLWWSQVDFGLLELLGKKKSEDEEETLVNVVAYRPS